MTPEVAIVGLDRILGSLFVLRWPLAGGTVATGDPPPPRDLSPYFTFTNRPVAWDATNSASPGHFARKPVNAETFA